MSILLMRLLPSTGALLQRRVRRAFDHASGHVAAWCTFGQGYAAAARCAGLERRGARRGDHLRNIGIHLGRL